MIQFQKVKGCLQLFMVVHLRAMDSHHRHTTYEVVTRPGVEPTTSWSQVQCPNRVQIHKNMRCTNER